MSKIVVKDLAGPASSSNKIYIASGSELDLANSTGTVNLAVDAGDIASGTLTNARLADGHILQIQSASFQGIQTIGTSDTDVTNLTCTMTITSGNKVFITASAFVGREQDDYGYLNITDGSDTVIYQNNTGTGSMVNGSMALTNAGSQGGSVHDVSNVSFGYLWTPGVTSITVKVRAKCTYGSNIYINRAANTGDAGYNVRATSHLTIMEVKA